MLLVFLQHFILINPQPRQISARHIGDKPKPKKEKKARHLLTTLPRGGSALPGRRLLVILVIAPCLLSPDLTNWRGRLPYCDGIRGLPFFITEVAALAGLNGLCEGISRGHV